MSMSISMELLVVAVGIVLVLAAIIIVPILLLTAVVVDCISITFEQSAKRQISQREIQLMDRPRGFLKKISGRFYASLDRIDEQSEIFTTAGARSSTMR